MKFLDTDTSVEVLRSNPKIREQIRVELGRVATTAVTVAELHYGAARSRDPIRELELIESVLGELPVWSLDHLAARQFGTIKAELEGRGERLPDADLFIAAICLSHGATLVTHNTRHFNRIPGLVIEDWLA
ncbi:MAG: type II toxin-antitoxin system VapC family toxin [Chloroflexi bacterium]|nr:type II toxin-antitoxin system VapC family toxin [Chloroflexota bacterium]